MSSHTAIEADVFAAIGLTPLDFQLAAREAYHAGRSGLIQVPTGGGKTLAAMAGPLERMVKAARDASPAGAGTVAGTGLEVLFVTPLRALSRDTERAVRDAARAFGASFTVECRTGDVPHSRRARQVAAMPNILITTPESLSVLLSRPGVGALFARLHTIIVDEWHELLSTKRGTQTELGLAHLRSLRPAVQTWALSATLGNPEEAARAACGVSVRPIVVRSSLKRPITVDVVEPPDDASLPWAGHLGLTMVPEVLRLLDPAVSTLIFTNTRKQAESWYRRILELAPEKAHRVALHHGSIDREIRARIEAEARAGRVTWTVATSSLDLGIDFAPVELVVQVGSPKSLARLIQRAGRSLHRPGRTARMLFVPTHALELVEIHAARERLDAPEIEPRRPLDKPLDVLAQHVVTLACGDGFEEEELLHEIRSTAAFAALTSQEFDWVLDFVASGGSSLSGYDHYRKLRKEENRWYVRDKAIARFHRMSIGTIDGNSEVRVLFTNGKALGTIEERFVARLSKGDTFYFAGRMLELVMLKDATVYVRTASRRTGASPSWPGGALPLSPSLGTAVRCFLDRSAGAGAADISVGAATKRLLRAQAETSAVPGSRDVLAEVFAGRGATHLFVFPFEGRAIHEGLAALVVARLQRKVPGSFGVSSNDYGFHLEAAVDYPFTRLLGEEAIFAVESAGNDLLSSVNADELARRTFRGIARVSGLVFPGYPGAQKSIRRLQASATLLYEVFAEHEPDNLLLAEARREALRSQLNVEGLTEVLRRLDDARILLVETARPSPLAFPLLLEQLTPKRSSLSISERVERLRRRYGLG